MKQCPKCSGKNSDDSRFCGNCGENLEGVESTSEDLSAMAGTLLKQANGLLGASAKKAQKAVAGGVEKAKEAAEAGKEKIQNVSQSSGMAGESAKKARETMSAGVDQAKKALEAGKGKILDISHSIKAHSQETKENKPSVLQRYKIFVRNGDENGPLNVKRFLGTYFAFLIVVLILSTAVLGVMSAARQASREKERAERVASRTASQNRAVFYCEACGGDGNDCQNCNGGRCPKCGGDGIFYESGGYKNGQPVSSGPYGCYVCGQTGICVECKNKGSCSACRSTGIELKCSGDDYCKTCRGTGICLQCKGKGCASCDHGYCGRCDRTGIATS